MRGILHDTANELLTRKLYWVFVIITGLAILAIMGVDNIDLKFQGMGDPNLGELNEAFGNPMLIGFYSFLGFLGIIAFLASANVFPGMLERGRAEFYFSKPVTRTFLYLSKFFSIWLVYSAVLVICGLSVYMALWFFHSISDSSFLLVIPFSSILLLFWLALSAFAGIWRRSTVFAIIVVLLVRIGETVVSAIQQITPLLESDTMVKAIELSEKIYPRFDKSSDILLNLATGARVDSFLPLWVAIIFTLVIILLSIWKIRRTDY